MAPVYVYMYVYARVRACVRACVWGVTVCVDNCGGWGEAHNPVTVFSPVSAACLGEVACLATELPVPSGLRILVEHQGAP